jgi:hypothetical protein
MRRRLGRKRCWRRHAAGCGGGWKGRERTDDCVEEDDAGDGIRMNLLVFYFCSTRKDACRQRDPEAAMVAILRRKRSIFHL